MTDEVLQMFKVMSKDNFTTDEEARSYIEEIFKGYSKRKKNKTLYSKDDLIPQLIIGAYYTYVDRLDINEIFSSFKRKYIYNENQLEEVHELKERQGLSKVYDYMQNYTNYSAVNIYNLLLIHQQLYSLVTHPEFGGSFRVIDVYLPGSGINLTNYDCIPGEIQNLYKESVELAQRGVMISVQPTPEGILRYIDDCIKMKCKLIKIHPFFDGNGRSSRALLNLYFKIAGIPPVYVTKDERLEYQEAMNKAICDEEYGPDFSSINRFYYYKLCDAIVQLDIGKREEAKKITLSTRY